MSDIDFLALAQEAAKSAPDFNEAQKGGGGGDYVPPPEGLARLRLVGYIETGRHDKGGQYAGKKEDRAHWEFELRGKNYEPKVVQKEDGTEVKIPFRMTITTSISRNEKATHYKLFTRLNWDGKATHPAQLLGKAFLGNVAHRKYKKTDGSEGIYPHFKDKQGVLTLRPPRVESVDDDGEVVVKEVKVGEPISKLRLFLWTAKPEHFAPMWAALDYDGGKELSRYQKEITKAENFEGSGIAEYLSSKGVDLGVPPAEDEKAGKANPAAEDNGLGDDDDIPY